MSIDKGAGHVPAMNREGPEAERDTELPPPGHRGWDAPADEAPQTLEGAVRRGEAEPPDAELPHDPDSPGEALAREDGRDALPEPNEPG